MNKTIYVSLIILISAFSRASYAQGYECFAKANPNRGFNFDFTIRLNSTSIGSVIFLEANGVQAEINKISQTSILSRANATQKDAFDLTLGYIAEEDVSGVSQNNLDQITSIEIFMGENVGDEETIVYKLFSGSQQIGGTISISGLGTACVPK